MDTLDGAELKRIREDVLQVSRAELARRLKVRPATVSDWERGARSILMPGILALALWALERGAGEEGKADDS
jgi:DNA-binding transcriptional regulator YiaG